MKLRIVVWTASLLLGEALFAYCVGPLAARAGAAFYATHPPAPPVALPIAAPWCAQTPTLVLLAVWALVVLIGVCGWQLARALAEGRCPLWGLLALQLAAGLILTASAASFSTDTYNYVVWGRLAGVYHINPYVLTKPLGGFLDSAIRLSIFVTGNPPPSDDYGPLWTELAGGLARVQVAATLWWQLWAHRFIALLGAVATSAALYRICRKVDVRERVRRTTLFALHPLVLYESAVGGHNDMLMVGLAAWAFALVEELPLISGLLIAASIAVKYLSIVVLPFLFLAAWRRNRASAMLIVAIVAAVLAVAFIPLWLGPQILEATLARRGFVAMSPTFALGMVFSALSHTAIVPATRFAQLLLSLAAAAVIALSIVAFAKTPKAAPVWRSVTAVLMASPTIFPWYAVWVAPAIAGGCRWTTYAWWLCALVFLRYALDAGLFARCELNVWPLAVIVLLIVLGPLLMVWARGWASRS